MEAQALLRVYPCRLRDSPAHCTRLTCTYSTKLDIRALSHWHQVKGHVCDAGSVFSSLEAGEESSRCRGFCEAASTLSRVEGACFSHPIYAYSVLDGACLVLWMITAAVVAGAFRFRIISRDTSRLLYSVLPVCGSITQLITQRKSYFYYGEPTTW